jgi:putative Mn2+ efflux pump MntP
LQGTRTLGQRLHKKKKKQETQTKEKQKNNANYGETFVLALSTSLDDATWYVDLSA